MKLDHSYDGACIKLIVSCMRWALAPVWFTLAGCDTDAVDPLPPSLELQSAFIARAIGACELPDSPSVVAYVLINQNRFLMTPSADGESASVTRTLSTDDLIQIEIEYTISGTSYVIAEAERRVPATGNVAFETVDFTLVDSDTDGTADCIELLQNSTLAAQIEQGVAGPLAIRAGKADSSNREIFLHATQDRVSANFDGGAGNQMQGVVTDFEHNEVARWGLLPDQQGGSALCLSPGIHAAVSWKLTLPARFSYAYAIDHAVQLSFDAQTSLLGQHETIVTIGVEYRDQIVASSVPISLPTRSDWESVSSIIPPVEASYPMAPDGFYRIENQRNPIKIVLTGITTATATDKSQDVFCLDNIELY